METNDPYSWMQLISSKIIFHPFDPDIFIWLTVLILLLICSALISGSEVAYFSLSPADINKLNKEKDKKTDRILRLHKMPERLLGSILISNNFVNVGIVIISNYIINRVVDLSEVRVLGFVFRVVIITFLLLFFGEILPKIYATQFAVKFARLMALPLIILDKIFKPISLVLILSTSIIRKKFPRPKEGVSMEDLSEALDLPSTKIIEDKEILKGIVRFGNIDVKEIMKARMDIFAINIDKKFTELLPDIISSGYSRIPVYVESFDTIKGILYIKDLLSHMHKPNTFRWQSLIRPPYFVPETKKINDLLEEFQTKKIHMAIVLDEYGGTHGLITLEDILEEIVGEITDEYDEEKITYKKLGEHTFLFEGKTQLNDFYKIIGSEIDIFNEVKGEADTLAGLILEIKGKIPAKDDVIKYRNFVFSVASADNRRIKEVKVKIEDFSKNEDERR